MSKKSTLRWMPLDNAAKIYPAARRKNWTNVFRLSATLTEPVDKEFLQSALDVTVQRFPSLAVRLRRGAFWYYLQQLPCAPKLSPEYGYPWCGWVKRSCGSVRSGSLPRTGGSLWNCSIPSPTEPVH